MSLVVTGFIGSQLQLVSSIWMFYFHETNKKDQENGF